MAQPNTVLTYPLNGTKDFAVPFEYLARKFVVVTLIGTSRKVLTINSDYRFTTRTQVTTTKAWAAADGYESVEIRRVTSATERLVDFGDGSILRAYDLNTAQVQSLHIAEEARDLTADTIGVNNDGNLDARGRRIVNLADAVAPGDAVTLRQEQAWAGSALGSANAAKTSETNSKTSETNAATSANAAASARDDSLTNRNAANTSKNAAATSATAAQASSDLAQKWATNPWKVLVDGTYYSAYHYALAARDYQTASATSASAAASSASQAATSASQAATEAAKLGNANAFMGTIDSVNASAKVVGWVSTWQLAFDTGYVNSFYPRSGQSMTMNANVGITGNGTVSGSLSVGGNITGPGMVQAYSQLAVQIAGADNTPNAHVWFRSKDASERALIYADQANQLHIRTNAASGGEGIVINASNYPTANGLDVAHRADRQTTFFKSGVNSGASMYGNCNLQLQCADGSLPALGFHSAGRYAAALFLNTDNNLYLSKNSGVTTLMVTTELLPGQIVGTITGGGLGGTAMLRNRTGANQGQGASIASGLNYADTSGAEYGAAPGTWRAMQTVNSSQIGIFMRIG